MASVRKTSSLDLVFMTLVLSVVEMWCEQPPGNLGFHAPCFGCQMYARMHADDPNPNKIQSLCTYPCKCNKPPDSCPGGGSLVRDGCDCCMVCGGQPGDHCDHKQPCDIKKGLKCEFEPRKSRGTCRAESLEPCMVHGITYHHKEQFKPDCGRLCTCQNGHYGCVSLCPQEDSKPSSQGCANARLVKITGKCCREWTCERMQADGVTNKVTEPRENDRSQMSVTAAPAPIEALFTCKRETSAWSACSKTCGMGISIRVTNDNAACQTVQQARFCLVRPCNWTQLEGKRCTRTMKVQKKNVRLKYKDCLSVKLYRPKYCSNCKKNKCCVPHITKTKTVTFECRHGVRERHDFMWIKNCKCHKDCPHF